MNLSRTLARVGTGSLILTLVLALAGMALHPGQGYGWASYFDAWLWQIIRFSVLQAVLSAVFSVVLAIPFAWALAQRPFRGQWLLAGFLNLAFVLPVLAVVLGIVALFGRQGWFPLDRTVYGLPGILLAHVALNWPFAVRLLWDRLNTVPLHQRRLATVLGLTAVQRLHRIEWPILKTAAGPVFVLITLLCFSSFTVVLTLGGGPANTNLEVAVYQALKYDFDSRGAALYALIHGAMALGLMAALGQNKVWSMETVAQSGSSTLPRATGYQWVAMAVLLAALLAPYLALTQRAMRASWQWPSQLNDAIFTSLGIAAFSATAAVLLALSRCVSAESARRRSLWLDFGVLVMPAMVLTTGLFLLCLRLGWARQATWPLIIWINALMAMPLILQPVKARMAAARNQYQRLTRVLGLTRWGLVRFVYWPVLWPVLVWALALSAVLSLGDMGVAALVGQLDFVTLPLMIYRAMGSYQMALAAQLMVGLLVLCAFLLGLAEWARGRGHA
jgi:thiamine transport system permease protein